MIKELLLKKGWAGKTISRAETVARLNPLIERHIRLNHLYAFAAREHGDQATREALAASQKIARTNVGKIAETIYSCGGTAYTGVDLEPDGANLGTDPEAMLATLSEAEQQFLDAVLDEEKVEHQMRTRAILGVVASSSSARLEILRGLKRDRR
jgi:hypothetical protein